MVPVTPLHRRSRAGFTIVELIVVMGIIGVLLALVLPALGGAMRRGYKTREMNDIKSVGNAWMLYANSNNDAALPGFLDLDVQAEPVRNVSRGWGVNYKMPNGVDSLQPTTGNFTGPWTWRLLSYLSYDHRLIHQYLDEPNPDHETLVSEGSKVAYQPAFGYNGYYLGGWWEMVKINGIDTPFAKFYDHCTVDARKRALSIPTTHAQIFRTSEMVAFCSSSNFASPGSYRRRDDIAGYHLVMPPMMELSARWEPQPGDASGAVRVLQGNTAAPIARYTNNIAVLYADGHVDQTGYNQLSSMRMWVNSADTPEFKHAQCNTAP